MSVVVYKLGGSLLTLPDLSQRLRDLFAVRRQEQPLLICGGGLAADIVREWDAVHRLGDEKAHWLALRAIQLNEKLLLTLCPNELSLVRTRSEAGAVWHAGRVPLLSLFEFVRDEEARPSSLSTNSDKISNVPHTWDVTSDSLAGWVAIRWPARRLVLLKSAELPITVSRLSFRAAVDLGLVDRHFPILEPDLPPTWWCSLRRSGAIEYCLFGR
jgi:aspartokinase-like uncharacterized kinase